MRAAKTKRSLPKRPYAFRRSVNKNLLDNSRHSKTQRRVMIKIRLRSKNQ